MEKASQRDHRRPVPLHSCEAEHKRDRSVQKGTGEYIKADRSCTPTKQDMLAFTAVDHDRLRIACGQVEVRAKTARSGQTQQPQDRAVDLRAPYQGPIGPAPLAIRPVQA